MSNQDDTRLTCDDVRSLAFDARASDDRESGLSDEYRAGFDRHLDDCSECRAYLGQLDGMLAGAAEADPADWADDEPDEAFDAIMDQVDERDADGEDADDEATVTFLPRSYYAAAGLAAGILLSVVGFVAWQGLESGPQRPGSGSAGVAGATGGEDDRPTPPGAEEGPGQTSPDGPAGSGRDLDRLARAERSERGIDIYASPGAAWAFTDRDPATVRLDAGTILVEYLPEGTEALRVKTDDTTVRVTGTVFYVSTDGGSTTTGVAEGSVEVDAADRETSIAVGAGERLGADREVEPMSDEERASIASHIDLKRHRETLDSEASPSEKSGASAPSTAEPDESSTGGTNSDEATSTPGETSSDRAPDEESAPAKSKPTADRKGGADRRPDLPGDVADLRQQARRAMSRKDFATAARKYESMLDDLPDGHGAVPSVHLDVARLYLRHLERPEAAADHLRTFVTGWPDDPAAASAREELCRISSDLGRAEPLCDENDGEQP